MTLTTATRRTIRHTLAICAAFAIGALGAQAGTHPASAPSTPASTHIAPLGQRLQDQAYRTDPDAEVIWDGAGNRYLVEMKGASIQEDDPRWDCARMGNHICG